MSQNNNEILDEKSTENIADSENKWDGSLTPKERKAIKEAEEKALKQLGIDSRNGKSQLEKQFEEYRVQQRKTEGGISVISVIEEMADKMHMIVGIKFKTGKLIPLKDAKTGEIIQFTEE